MARRRRIHRVTPTAREPLPNGLFWLLVARSECHRVW